MEDCDKKHLRSVMRHINKVRDNCTYIVEKLIEEGEIKLAKDLLISSYQHDISKISNEVEWKFLRDDFKGTTEFNLALQSHLSSNEHHPEYWGDNPEEMPRYAIAEMVADWKARSEEFGTDLRSWIMNIAIKKYNIKEDGKVMKEINHILGLLLEKPFS